MRTTLSSALAPAAAKVMRRPMANIRFATDIIGVLSGMMKTFPHGDRFRSILSIAFVVIY
jgi:hypothetical protein